MSTIYTDDALGDWAANQALTTIFGTPRWLALHTSNPRSADANEVFGLAYIRQQLTFSAPSARAVANINACAFNGLDEIGAIPYLAVWTRVTGGQLVMVVDTTRAPLSVGKSGFVRVEIGDIAFQF